VRVIASVHLSQVGLQLGLLQVAGLGMAEVGNRVIGPSGHRVIGGSKTPKSVGAHELPSYV